MDGIHDVGGMDGLGPIDRTSGDHTFRAHWQGAVHAMVILSGVQGISTMDRFRYAIERMAPRWYLEAGYYERWLAALEKLHVEGGTVDRDALAERAAAFAGGEAAVPDRADPALRELARGAIQTGGDTSRPDADPVHDVGDRVRVRNHHPRGHTRCPGYVRNASGTVRAHHGTHVLPDTNAHGAGEQPEPLYTVCFTGEELWGRTAEPETTVRVDLWERYLEPA